ncbi:site-specific integrase [Streptosporangium subroseum]|uniref:site-specific integrase n=1 Tax=Streptosporangium subroseum TaxID=106412 RepID=UPI00308D1452|nr:tyrosine-type recombinase/integrase [Streptosporangium subroseum]
MTETASREIEIVAHTVPAVVSPAATTVAHTDADFFLSDAAREAVSAGMPASTMRAYTKDWNAFSDWCASTGRLNLPATPETVTEYVTHLTTAISARTGKPLGPASIDRALASIRTLHGFANQTAPDTKAARRVLAGYKAKLATTHSAQARTRKAEPAVPDALRSMLATLDRSTLAGMRNAALLLLGYATAARISELVALNLDDVRETEDGLLVNVYRSKVKTFTETAVPYGSNPATCPVRAVRALLVAMTAAERTTGPLFIRIDRHGKVAAPMTRKGVAIGDVSGRMTPKSAADVVTKVADAAGLEGSWTGHSLRRGFATAARRAGASLERIGRHGGWKDGSTALLGYLEEGDRWTDNPVAGL